EDESYMLPGSSESNSLISDSVPPLRVEGFTTVVSAAPNAAVPVCAVGLPVGPGLPPPPLNAIAAVTPPATSSTAAAPAAPASHHFCRLPMPEPPPDPGPPICTTPGGGAKGGT